MDTDQDRIAEIETIVDGATLELILDTNAASINNWVRSGIIQKKGRNEYLLVSSIRRYVQSIRNKKGNNSLELQKRRELADTIRAEKEAELKELELQKKRGEVIAADVALKILIKCQAPIKAGLEQMPRLCYEVNPSDPEHARTILERHKMQIFESIEKSLEQIKELDSTDKPNDS